MNLTPKYLKNYGLPKINGRINVKGLDSSITIIRDKWGCPHIKAKTEQDGWFGQGFVHAQDRLWQMERTRRFSRGTLSEILGEPLINIDKYYRRLGLRRLAIRDFPQLNYEAQGILESFAAGVNGAIASMQELPPEFKVLDLTPEAWSPVDSIAVWKTIFLTQTTDFSQKIFRAAIAQKLGIEALKILEPEYPEQAPVISSPLPAGKEMGQDIAELSEFVNDLMQISASTSGSNNWVVNGKMSAGGKPLLASDPHGVIQTAPIWYMNHLLTPGWEAIGVNTPGVPGILLFGHNEHVGWCVTNALADISDLYIEKFDKDFHKYLYRDRWLEAEIRHEEIKVKDRIKSVVEDIPVTIHGPIISGGPSGQGDPLAWRWTGQKVATTFECISGMVRARNVDEFRESQVNWSGPSMNRVIADDSGNIAYQLMPDIPVRKHHSGNPVPVPGWTGEFDWQGDIMFSELPLIKNPEKNYIVTANNRVAPIDYKYHLNSLTIPYRANRINQILEKRENMTLEDFKAMQADLKSDVAVEILDIMKVMIQTDCNNKAMMLLCSWNAEINESSTAAALYEVFLQKLLNKLFACTDGLAGRKLAIERWWLCYLDKLAKAIKAGDQALINMNPDLRGQNWERVITASLDEAWEFLEEILGKDPSKWAWGKLHRQTFVHNLGRTPPYDKTFNISSIGIGGDSTTVFNSGGPYTDTFTPNVGVSFRMLLDLSDFKRCLWVLPPGQSGHPGSKHYRDGITPLKNGKYFPMLWDWEEIKKKSEGTLRLIAEKKEE